MLPRVYLIVTFLLIYVFSYAQSFERPRLASGDLLSSFQLGYSKVQLDREAGLNGFRPAIDANFVMAFFTNPMVSIQFTIADQKIDGEGTHNVIIANSGYTFGRFGGRTARNSFLPVIDILISGDVLAWEPPGTNRSQLRVLATSFGLGAGPTWQLRFLGMRSKLHLRGAIGFAFNGTLDDVGSEQSASSYWTFDFPDLVYGLGLSFGFHAIYQKWNLSEDFESSSVTWFGLTSGVNF